MQPLVANLQSKCSKNVNFAHVDIDAPSSKTLTRKYGVSSIPRYVLVDSSGKVIDQWVGTGPASKFDSMMVYCTTK